MPYSDDETFMSTLSETSSTMSKAELRKTHKPIMEKRRRARINHCLNEIKGLILEAMNKDPTRHSKLEKADILEMAVKHLQNVQRQQMAMAMATDSSVLKKFKNGFSDCAGEIDKYIALLDGVDNDMKNRISSHLQKCISGIEQVSQLNFPGISNLPLLLGANIFPTRPTKIIETPSNQGDQNNNPQIQIPQGIQLIPSRLPSGELALLVPNSKIQYLPSSSPSTTTTIQPRPSAFATVVPSKIEPSKPLSPPISPEQSSRPQSPQGFRPVHPIKPRFTCAAEDYQVAQVSSTSFLEHQFTQPMEVKNIKFPIHKEPKRMMSPKKLSEPLCIITNNSERYRQAQTREDAVNFVENLIPHKRKFCEVVTVVNQGLLTVAPPQDFSNQSDRKRFKGEEELDLSGGFRANMNQKDDQQKAGSSKSNYDQNNDMWRPW